MKALMKSPVGLVLLAVMFFALAIGLSQGLKGKRIDLTENKLYTLSDGTLRILDQIDQPIALTLYYSDKASRNLAGFRTYAARVKELLDEYVVHSHGKLTLAVVDPEPFSEAEDAAAIAGLQGVPVGATSDTLYLGLVGELKESKDSAPADEDAALEPATANVTQATIPFFQLNKEAQLEYDLSQLIYKLEHPEPPVVGVISGLPLQGEFDYASRRQGAPWMISEQLESLFDVRQLEPTLDKIDSDIKVLILVHPTELTPAAQLAIDQYVLGGGRVILALDAFAENAAGGMGMMAPPARRSDLDKLLAAWGLKLSNEIVGDYDNGLVVSVGANRSPIRHIGLLGLGKDDFAEQVLMSGLDNINLSTAGALETLAGHTTSITPLLQSSDQSMLLDPKRLETAQSPEVLLDGFKPSGKRYLLAALVTGKAKTAFPEGVTVEEPIEAPVTQPEAAQQTADANTEPEKPATRQRLITPGKTEGEVSVMVLSDADWLSDRLWVQVENFFGQRVASPWADNGAWLANAVDYMAGSRDLSEIRTRGRFTRPFTRVDALRRQAESRLLEKQQSLQDRLQATETRLSELEKQRNQHEQGVLTAAQQQEILKFQDEKLAIRRDLRDVQHQLNRDIDDLGVRLKLLNILAMPLLLTLALAGLVLLWRRMVRR